MVMLRGLLSAVVASLLLTACGKNEPPAKARANAPLQLPKSALEEGAGKSDPNEALKDRLARQEAASKLFDKAKPEPPPPPPKAEPKAEPAKSAAAAKAEPVKAEPAKPVETPPPVAEKKAEPAPPPAAAPAPAPRTDIAAAKPAAPPPSVGVPAAKLVSRVDPEFPREAVQQGISKGLVKVRMTLDGNGNVMKVDVVEAQPRRIFDRSVVRALSQWRFNDGPSGRVVETEVEFGSR